MTLALLIAVALVICLYGWALCAAAGQADERLEQERTNRKERP